MPKTSPIDAVMPVSLLSSYSYPSSVYCGCAAAVPQHRFPVYILAKLTLTAQMFEFQICAALSALDQSAAV